MDKSTSSDLSATTFFSFLFCFHLSSLHRRTWPPLPQRESLPRLGSCPQEGSVSRVPIRRGACAGRGTERRASSDDLKMPRRLILGRCSPSGSPGPKCCSHLIASIWKIFGHHRDRPDQVVGRKEHPCGPSGVERLLLKPGLFRMESCTVL